MTLDKCRAKDWYNTHEGWMGVLILSVGTFTLGLLAATWWQTRVFTVQIDTLSTTFTSVISQKDEIIRHKEDTIRQKDTLISQLKSTNAQTSKAVVDVSKAVIKNNEDAKQP